MVIDWIAPLEQPSVHHWEPTLDTSTELCLEPWMELLSDSMSEIVMVILSATSLVISMATTWEHNLELHWE